MNSEVEAKDIASVVVSLFPLFQKFRDNPLSLDVVIKLYEESQRMWIDREEVCPSRFHKL